MMIMRIRMMMVMMIDMTNMMWIIAQLCANIEVDEYHEEVDEDQEEVVDDKF